MLLCRVRSADRLRTNAPQGELYSLYRPASAEGASKPGTVDRPSRMALEFAEMYDDANTWPTLAALLVAGLALAYVLWRPDFVIRVRDGQCRCTGNLPLVVRKAVAQFLLDDLRPTGRVTICGQRRHRRLKLWYWGKLSRGEKQRIRNFLLTRH